MDLTLTWHPLIPETAAYLLLGLAALPLVFALYGRSRGAILRTLALAALAAALFNPSIRKEDREPLSDIAVLVIDKSLSQEIGGRTATTEDAARKIAEAAANLPNTEVRTTVVMSGESKDEEGTRAFDALNRALADIPPERYAGALMVTDGEIHDVPKTLKDRGYEGPLHALITGERGETDRRLIVERAPRFGIVGQPQTLSFRVEDQGVEADGTPVKELSLIAFPTRELFVEKLSEFDLVIFDRYERRGILPNVYLSNVVDYVQNGGAVLVASGPDFASPLSLYDTPLSGVLPAAPAGTVTVEPFKPAITKAGQRHPVTRDLPGGDTNPPRWGRWFRVADTAGELAGDVVMAGPEEKPLMILSRHGEGRVALMLSDQAWLWARGFEGGGPQTELLRRLAHWLMKEPELEEEALRGRQEGRSLVIERRTMAEKTEPVTVTMPSGKTATVTLTESAPGLWRGTLTSTENGIHRLNDSKLSVVAALGEAGTKELEELIATDTKLAPLLAETRGGSHWLGREATARMPRLAKADAGRSYAGSGWLALKSNGAYRVRAVNELPLFGTLIGLAILLALASAMWFREGR